MISIPALHLICLSPTTLLSARGSSLHAGGRADSPSDKATRPCLTFHPFSSLILPRPFLPRTQTRTLSPCSLSLCVRTEDRGQAAWQAGGLVCGIVLISTGIWRRKLRYLPAQPLSSKPPLISLLLPLSLSLCLWRLLPSCRLRRQVCEGCRCQLSFSWTTANLSPYLPSVVISSFIPISLSLFPPTSPGLSVNELCVLSLFLFSSLVSGRTCVFFLGREGGGMRTGCYGALIGTLAQRYQGRAGRSAPRSVDSLCPPHHASSAICEQCVKLKTDTPFPPRPGHVCLLQWPEKGQKSMGRQRELYIPSEQ